MNSIISLEEYKIASFDLKSTKTDEGSIENITLDGTRYGIYNFIDYEHDLKLEYLTKEELAGIEAEFNIYLKNNSKPSFPSSWLEKFDFIQHGGGNENISFMISLKGYKSKQNKLPKMYDLTLKFIQRLVL